MVLISATMPRQLAEFASVGNLKHHVLVRLDTEHILSKTLKVGHYLVLPADRCMGVGVGGCEFGCACACACACVCEWG
jgi:hypothetical protein